MGFWWLWKVSAWFLSGLSIFHGFLKTAVLNNFKLNLVSFFVPTCLLPMLTIIPKFCRLGHREQKDEWSPRRVDAFQNRNVLPPDAVISAGSVNSSCTAGRLCIKFPGSPVLI